FSTISFFLFPSPVRGGVRGGVSRDKRGGEKIQFYFCRMFTPKDPRLISFARTSRKVPTLSEAQLWHELRSRKLAGLKFRRQHPLHPFIVDFFCPEHRLVVEVDGDVHDRSEIKVVDNSRQANLESRG